jgi:hypothetical protein
MFEPIVRSQFVTVSTTRTSIVFTKRTSIVSTERTSIVSTNKLRSRLFLLQNQTTIDVIALRSTVGRGGTISRDDSDAIS